MTKRLHPLVSATKVKAKELNLDDYNVINTRYHYALSIRVGKKLVPRTIRILDRIVKIAEKRGYKIGINEKNYLKTKDSYIEISGYKIEFIIEETVKRFEHVPTKAEIKSGYMIPNYDHFPVGTLNLRIDGYHACRVKKKFYDTKSRLVEDQIYEFLGSLENIAAFAEEEHIKWLEDQKLREIRKLEEIEKDKLKKIKLEKIKNLEIAANNFDQVQKIKKYIKYLKSKNSLSKEQLEQINFSEEYLRELEG